MDDLDQSQDNARPLPTTPGAPYTAQQRSVISWVITTSAVAFAFGLIANPWFERNVRTRLPAAIQETIDPLLRARIDRQAREIASLDARLNALDARFSRQQSSALTTAPSDQLAQMQARIDKLDQDRQSIEQQVDKLSETMSQAETVLDAAATGTERAQEALLLTSIRRRLETGRRLGPLEATLRRTFGNTAPVEAVIALGQAPVTPRSLQYALIRLRSGLVQPDLSSEGDWWASIKAGLADIIDVRRTNASTRTPTERIDQATRLLMEGDVAAAIIQINALSPRKRAFAAGWLANAHRQIAAMRALESIEIATLDQPTPSSSNEQAQTIPTPTRL